ncbi:T9SS type A sorting domain-containing protein [Pontibacter sp. H259]|uniref:T9SS type A sorting domain-containing protein n=1 Tax=Pontibacter sp. H259 TaxID=3133421 RepID=UPI0030BBBDBF
MKMNQKYAWAIVAVPFMLHAFTANAQDEAKSHPEPKGEHEMHTACTNDSETLSGIFLTPAAKGTFKLDFEQQLKENAVLEITNTAGKKVYQKPMDISKNQKNWSYNVGRLKPDTYLVEVKTSDTTYWTKFKIGD